MYEPINLPAIQRLHLSGYLSDKEERISPDFTAVANYECDTVRIFIYDLPDAYTGLGTTAFGFALKMPDAYKEE